MTRKTLCSLLALAGLTLSLAAAPLTAQSTQPNTQPATASQTQAASAKKTKAKKAKTGSSSTAAKAAPASSTTPPATGTNNSSKVPAKTKAAASSTAAVPPQKGMVWVNTASGVYHGEGTKYYGKTKQGKYMTEADAQKAGYHAAKGEKP